jgi:hypothetical protein
LTRIVGALPPTPWKKNAGKPVAPVAACSETLATPPTDLTTGGSGNSLTLPFSIGSWFGASREAFGGIGLLGTLDWPPHPPSQASVTISAMQRRFIRCSYLLTAAP